jgi:ABC-2 type transport system ATP-binding protein
VEDSVGDPFAIETVDLCKRYDGVDALRGLELQIPAGSICGLLGKNGAGKTTALKILLGMVRPTSGDARVFGLASADAEASVAIRRRTGFVSDDKDLYGYMSVMQMTRFTASFYPGWRTDLEQHYLRAFELPADRTVKALSRGMRTKLSLLLALCRGAELLILDEPTSGLDPAVTEEILQALVRHVATAEMTIFFATHQIAEVDQIADRVAIIHHGRTVVAGALDDVREKYRRVQFVFDGEAPAAGFRAPGVTRVWRSGRVLTVLSREGAEEIVAEARALQPASIEVMPATLKEIFLETVAAED